MGFFSKLFGSSKESPNKPSKTMENNSPSIDSRKSEHNKSPFSDFFGIDMYKSPSKDWKVSNISNESGRIITFEKHSETKQDNDIVFDHCEALVFGNKSTNFIFEAPYDYDLLAKAVFFIERNFVDKSTTMLRATLKYEDKLEEYNYDPFLIFEVHDNSYSIQYTRNRDNGNMRFIVRTSFCNKELDYDQLEKEYNNALAEPSVNVASHVEEAANDEVSPFTDFLGVNMLKSPNKDWKLINVIHDAGRQMTFEKEINLNPDVYHVFDRCKALVLGDKFTNYIFEAPYDYHLLAKAIYFIEKTFVDKHTTMLHATLKYENEMKEYNYGGSIDFEVHDDSFFIEYKRNRNNGNMTFIIRTSFCYKELDYDQLEKDFNNAITIDNNNIEENKSNEIIPGTAAETDDTEKSGSTIYIPTENSSFVRASFNGKNMSFNSINERLGIRTKLFYIWTSKDYNINISFKAFSKDIICIISNNNLGESLSASFVKSLMERDGFEYDSAFSIYSRERLMEDGISEEFLTQAFMEEVTHKKCIDNVLIDAVNGYRYIFENGLMKAFASIDGLVGQAKEMKGTALFSIVKSIAKKQFGNEQEVIKELNAQFKAYAHIPIDQLPIVAGQSYNYNYCRYYLENCNPNITMDEFKEYTHNQYVLINDTVTLKSYKFNNKVYTFNQLGYIVYGASSSRKAHLMAHADIEKELDVIYSNDVNDQISSICLEIEAGESTTRLAINFCETKTKGVEGKFFFLNAIGSKIIARDVYTQEYYFTAQSNALANILQSGKQYLGNITDIDITDIQKPIFEISFMKIGS